MDADQNAVPPGEHAVLLDAIGRLTGLDRPWRQHPPPSRWWDLEDDGTPEPSDGVAVEVLGGAIDQTRDRVAWVERRTVRPDGDGGWIRVWLNLAGEDMPRVSVPLVPDRDDKVTGVDFLRFFDVPTECLVIGFSWAGDRKRLCRLTPCATGPHSVHRVDLGGSAAVVVDDSAWYLRESYTDDLMYGLRLPDLTPLTPIPVPPRDASACYTWHALDAGAPGTVRWTERLADNGAAWRDGRGIELRLPGARQRGSVDAAVLWNRLRASFSTGAPPGGPDILIGALAVPFWEHTAPTASTTDVGEVLQGPWWFPAGWYHHLRTAVAAGGVGRQPEASAWLAWLDQLASQSDDGAGRAGWDPSWSREEGVTRFASAHLRRQAGVLAAACRAGEVPVLGDFGTWRKPPNLAGAPPGFARAWRELPDQFRAGRFPVGSPNP